MQAQPNCSPAELLASLPETDRIAAIKSLSDSQAHSILYDWRGFWARPSQLPPPGDWRYWLLQAGRGFGKTRVGAETVREWGLQKLPAPIHLIGPTAGDVRDVMVEGPSGILSCYPAGQAPLYEPSKRRIIWANGNVARLYSADEPERLRGPQCCRFWADELAAWRFIDDAWDNLSFGFRIGDNLRGVITTTPKPIDLLRSLISNPACVVTRGSTYDNRANLAPGFFTDIITKYEGTRLGRQELNAELLEDLPGALWRQQMIDALRIKYVDVRWDLIIRIVVAIDPAVTAAEDSDETGIVVCGLTISGHVIVLDDLSCKESPLGWARVAVGAYNTRRADLIVGEVNNGGDLVGANIHAVAPHVNFRSVRATRGKTVRAEPVAALYEQGRVHHVGFFAEMEKQMCEYVPGVSKKSPDRMDALVWAITELVVDPALMHDQVILNAAGSYQISAI